MSAGEGAEPPVQHLGCKDLGSVHVVLSSLHNPTVQAGQVGPEREECLSVHAVLSALHPECNLGQQCRCLVQGSQLESRFQQLASNLNRGGYAVPETRPYVALLVRQRQRQPLPAPEDRQFSRTDRPEKVNESGRKSSGLAFSLANQSDTQLHLIKLRCKIGQDPPKLSQPGRFRNHHDIKVAPAVLVSTPTTAASDGQHRNQRPTPPSSPIQQSFQIRS